MKKQKHHRFLRIVTYSLAIGIGLLSSRVASQAMNPADEGICYHMVYNKVREEERKIYLLVDPVHFTEDKLRTLMQTLFYLYPEPEVLRVDVRSNVEQFAEFQDGEPVPSHFPHRQGPRPANKYASAYFLRQNGNELIRYNLPGGQKITVVVKGVDPLGTK